MMQHKTFLWFRGHKKILIKLCCLGLLLVALLPLLGSISLRTTAYYLHNMDSKIIFLHIVLALFTVSTLTLYDLILSRTLDVKLSLKEVFKTSWVSHTVGNFMIKIESRYSHIGFFLYKLQGVGTKKAGLMQLIINDKNLNLKAKIRFYLILALCFRWFVASIFFLYLLNSVVPIQNPYIVIAIFLIGVFISSFTSLPIGIGIFEVFCLYSFKTLGYSIQAIFIALVMYRVYYYLVPWLISMIILAWSIISHKHLKLTQQQKVALQTIGIYGLTALLFSLGVYNIFSSYLPIIIEKTPLMLLGFYQFFGLLLILLSKRIYHRISSAYTFTKYLLAIGILFGIIESIHSLEILLLFLLLIMLLQSKELFYRQPAPFRFTLFLKYFLIFFVLGSSYMVFYNSYISVQNNILVSPLSIILFSVFWLITFIVLALLISLTHIQKLGFEPPTESDFEKLTTFLNKYEGNSMTHLAYLKDKNFFYCCEDQVLILFRAYKDKLIALGDPIGDSDYFNEAIHAFRTYAYHFNMTPLFYEVSEKYLPIYHENGLRFLKLGEEAIIDLKTFTFAGKKGAPLRTIKNKMDRGEFDFELIYPPFSTDQLEMLQSISDAWLGDRKEKGFSLGFFNFEYLNHAPIGIIKKDDQILGFASILPFYCDHTVSIDLMRLIPNPPNGAMDALFIGLITWAIESNYQYFVLGKAPLANVGTNKFSTSSEKIAKYIYEYGNKIYSFKGLRRYKEKFYPLWKSTYLAYPKGTNLSLVILNLTKLISNSEESKGDCND